MIYRYNYFLFENKVASMVNESIIVYSKKLRKLLKDIDSPISKFLIEIENKDIDVASNYFDISDNKDTISFISDRKAQELINNHPTKVKFPEGNPLTNNVTKNGEIFKLLNYTPDGPEQYCPDVDQIGEVVAKAVSPVSGNTYLKVKFGDNECIFNQNYAVYIENEDLWKKNRQSVRTGRGIRSLLSSSGMKFSDSEIEGFVNKYKSAYDRMNDIYRNFDLVNGESIAHWYRHVNYLHGTNRGTLSNSCMATVNSNFFQIYTDNPEVCSLLILRSEENPDKIKGRALIWNLSDPKIIFMDRIYTHNDSDIQLFRDFARFKKWHYKPNNDSSDTPNAVNPNGDEERFEKLSVTLKNDSYSRYPYVDTLKYFLDGILSTVDDSSAKLLESTSGGYEGNDGCDRCDGSGEIECYNCEGDGRVDCETCDGSGYEACNDCDGDGNETCSTCDGEGSIDGKPCDNCDGKGEIKCDNCDGKGETTCSNCDGSRTLTCGRCDGEGSIDCPDCS